MAKVAKDIFLSEITLRKYEKPYDIKGRELVKKICLSIGLLQPGDSRDVIVDVFQVLLSKKELSSEEITQKVIANRKKNKLPLVGVANSNIRRQIRRLKNLFLIEKINSNYRINENANLKDIFQEKIKEFYLKSILNRVEEYFQALDNDISS